jgi:hypothetical protein
MSPFTTVAKIATPALALAVLFSSDLLSAAHAMEPVSDVAKTVRPLIAATTSPPKPPRQDRKPETRVDLKSWGVTVTGRNQRGRGLLSDRKASRPKASDSRPSSSRPRNQVPVKDAALQDFRIGIGICGHPIGDSPGLTKCLPAIEEDRPNQPSQPQPETTPSMVVAIRIPRPTDVQWQQVLSESRNVLFPKLRVMVQPAGRTLVNLDTIVYTDQSRVSTQTVTILGFPVEVEAMPMSYTWHFGDGSSTTTTTPGRPYPVKDITHKYMKKGGVGLTLTTNYATRFNVAGTGWQYVDGLVPITGPVTALQVREAVPVLVEPGR